MTGIAKTIMARADALGEISEEADCLIRTFCSAAMRRAVDLAGSWMREAGMTVREDAIGNLIGRYEGTTANAKVFLLGSHLDTVRNAGKFDGSLGVLTAIACVEHLRSREERLPFAIEVLGFADEEGVRYQSTYLGSKVLAGTFNPDDLKRVDAKGIAMAEAIRTYGGRPEALAASKLNGDNLLGYLELHIEQGPVLEAKNLAAGVVSAIAGQTRAGISFVGKAGHAGTVPMSLRKDALCAAAEFILQVEACGKTYSGLVATVGKIGALPGASNVIPGEVKMTLDVRHADDKLREGAVQSLLASAKTIGKKRRVEVSAGVVHEAASVQCDASLSGLLELAVKTLQTEAIRLPSGAGHDAAALSAIMPVAMLFVRCKEGLSHHPDESVKAEDIEVGVNVMIAFLRNFAAEYNPELRRAAAV
jgi:allantoate deiminase